MPYRPVVASLSRRSISSLLPASAWTSAMFLVISVLAGCHTSYKVPGGPADFHALGIDSNTVAALTDVTVNMTLVMLRAENVTVVAAPALSSAPTLTLVPSLNVSLPPVTLSFALGRS